MPQIWAAEPNRIKEYLEAIENATDEQREKALSLFGGEIEETPIFSIDGDTATLQVVGVLRKAVPAIARYFGFGGTTYAQIIEAIEEIKGTESVERVKVVYDSPGGDVNGLDEAYQAMADLAKSKEVVAEVKGMLCSAAYYLAAPSTRIESSAPTNLIGAIGIIISAVSYNGNDEKFGIKRIIIRSKNAPDKFPEIEDKKGQAVIQKRVDALERIFFQRIAEGRNISVEEIAERFGRGDVFVSQDPDPDEPDAITAGMIDAVVSLIPITTKESNSKPEVKAMPTLKELMAEDPALKAEVESLKAEQFKAGQQSGVDKVEARIKKVAPYIGADSEYPKAIGNLAINVLKGEEDPAALTGAVTVFDAQKEENANTNAQEETKETGDTPGGGDGGQDNATGEVATEEDYQALIESERKK